MPAWFRPPPPYPAPATTGESWPQRIEGDWLLAEEVAAQDQLGGLVTTRADAAGDCDGLTNDCGFLRFVLEATALGG
ncbi:MAG TPA: hypothetical protein VI136_17915 [Verrucomicrobiae bacterium]